MPKINIYLPDDLAEAVKDAGVPVSAVCQRALEQAVRRVTSIREIAVSAPGSAAGGPPPSAPFTKRAVGLLELAQRTAKAGALGEVGTEQVLGALIYDEHSMAVRVLRSMEITPQQVRAELARRADSWLPVQFAGTAAAAVPAGLPGLGSHVALVVELAANESSGLGNGYIGTEHLLLGLIGEPDGPAGHALRALGADLRITRRTVAAALAGWGARAELAAREQSAAGQSDATAATGQVDHGTAQGRQIADQVAAAIKAELVPVLARINRLESLTAG
jgi:ATP-dependent Clp protease ATP-binding subunit ClpA